MKTSNLVETGLPRKLYFTPFGEYCKDCETTAQEDESMQQAVLS
jgi:hypothetical protein